MSGYVAVARIRSVSPHVAVAEPSRRGELVMTIVARSETDASLVTALDDPLPAPGPSLRERWAAAGERWSQLTFYLTDPDSWR